MLFVVVQGDDAEHLRACARQEQWNAQQIAEVTVNLLLGEHQNSPKVLGPMEDHQQSSTRTNSATAFLRPAVSAVSACASTVDSGQRRLASVASGYRTDPELELVRAWMNFANVAKGYTVRASA